MIILSGCNILSTSSLKIVLPLFIFGNKPIKIAGREILQYFYYLQNDELKFKRSELGEDNNIKFTDISFEDLSNIKITNSTKSKKEKSLTSLLIKKFEIFKNSSISNAEKELIDKFIEKYKKENISILEESKKQHINKVFQDLQNIESERKQTELNSSKETRNTTIIKNALNISQQSVNEILKAIKNAEQVTKAATSVINKELNASKKTRNEILKAIKNSQEVTKATENYSDQIHLVSNW